MKKLIFVLCLFSLLKYSFSGEETATSGFMIFRSVKVSKVQTEFTGYSAVLLTNPSNSTESWWFFIDPTLGADGAKALLSTALAAKSTGANVDAVYWGTQSNVKHDFQGKAWITADRRLHTLNILEQ
jgi:hypothetical protein